MQKKSPLPSGGPALLRDFARGTLRVKLRPTHFIPDPEWPALGSREGRAVAAWRQEWPCHATQIAASDSNTLSHGP